MPRPYKWMDGWMVHRMKEQTLDVERYLAVNSCVTFFSLFSFKIWKTIEDLLALFPHHLLSHPGGHGPAAQFGQHTHLGRTNLWYGSVSQHRIGNLGVMKFPTLPHLTPPWISRFFCQCAHSADSKYKF